jgi:hypothetical protein
MGSNGQFHKWNAYQKRRRFGQCQLCREAIYAFVGTARTLYLPALRHILPMLKQLVGLQNEALVRSRKESGVDPGGWNGSGMVTTFYINPCFWVWGLKLFHYFL